MRVAPLAGVVAGALILGCAAQSRNQVEALAGTESGPFHIAACTQPGGDALVWAEHQLDAPVSIVSRPGLGPRSPEGAAELRFVVGPDGVVELCNVEVLAASSAMFADTAEASLRQARYSNPTRDGRAVRVRLQRRFSVAHRIVPLPGP